MNPKIDLYLEEGCGRCKLYKTPECKVHSWNEELVYLRIIALESELKEELKWSQPCYTYHGKNILMITAFKNYAALSFFKGSLLIDEKNILHAPGEHSHAARFFRFTSIEEIANIKGTIMEYIFEAIEIEKAGLKVNFKKSRDPIPEELILKFKEMPILKEAFDSLTPGRQRSYILHISQAKQAATRIKRVEKCIDKILSGKGFNEP